MPFDKAAFAKHLRDNAGPPFGKGKCATFVRQAMEAGGLSTVGRPRDAKDYGPFLQRLGFQKVEVDASYVPLTGDIAVMPGNPSSSAGHVEGWDGRNWISDFVQREVMPGPAFRTKGVYEVYRHP
ncbi:hypothetical protein [Sphingomonas sp.]|uniref:hypothetical protein n=1 Tax=Sphingomonas sp. TaxID=28214 RepID=UPI003B003CA0